MDEVDGELEQIKELLADQPSICSRRVRDLDVFITAMRTASDPSHPDKEKNLDYYAFQKQMLQEQLRQVRRMMSEMRKASQPD